MNFFLGVDPGYSGGLALISASGLGLQTFPMPDTEADIAEILLEWKESIIAAAIEKVHSMPKQGVASSFKFGYQYGLLSGLVVAFKIPLTRVTPQTWQKRMGCLTHGDKNISKARAQELFPKAKITHKTADAILIAEWQRRIWNEQNPRELGWLGKMEDL